MSFGKVGASNDRDATRAIDKLVLASVNAPYRREIDAATLHHCLQSGRPGDWQVHVATFFTDLSPSTILSFASSRKISGSDLARAYAEMKAATGESNPDLEAELVSLAGAA